ncbi:hypothetical protein F4779DRAFT_622928 [Xylariaceae sp. FL0662B]|nr:hypothetical protein F4779DRAFT_622928 [Xylariaceae sp. FL0662B]
MYLPRFEGRHDRDGLLFLALCSIRRLLNRIHNTLYASSPSAARDLFRSGNSASIVQNSGPSTITSMERILGELERQLDEWYSSLPLSIKPDLSVTVPRDGPEAWVRLRYWSAKHIICRPCLMYAATWSSNLDMPGFVFEYSKMCIDSSRNYIQTALHTLDKRTHYSWMAVQACLSNSLILAVAVTSSSLYRLVPDIKEILSGTTKSLEPLSTPDSSVEVALWILRTLTHKIQLHAAQPR